jgi:peptidoglycan hydrolase CwlO-like protein
MAPAAEEQIVRMLQEVLTRQDRLASNVDALLSQTQSSNERFDNLQWLLQEVLERQARLTRDMNALQQQVRDQTDETATHNAWQSSDWAQSGWDRAPGEQPW